MNKPDTFDEFDKDLLAAEKHQLAKWLPDIFGYCLVALSEQWCAQDLQSSKIRARFVASAHCATHSHLMTQPDALAFADNSLDCLIYHHQLGYINDLKQLLTEADRVLISHGQLIFIDVNPQRLRGWWQRYIKGKQPDPKQRYSRSTLIASLADSAFMLEESQLFYKLPWRTWSIIEAGIAKLWPKTAVAYAFRLRKKSPCFIPPAIPYQTLAPAKV